MLTLSLSFFVVAFLYSTVGFGGGTSYIAILGLSGTHFYLIPKISLICNLLVVTGGCWHYWKKKHIKHKLVAPFLMTSVPMAFLGGSFPLSEKNFYILLIVALSISGVRILFIKQKYDQQVRSPSPYISLLMGTLLGLVSGMVGIGGGIFLSPLLINMGWARSKEAAALASIFILLNSLGGLAGQFYKDPTYIELLYFIPLFVSVLLGGQFGSKIGTHASISNNFIQRCTGILTLFISLRLFLKVL